MLLAQCSLEWTANRLLLKFLSVSLGVSRCIRPLLRLLRPGVALRCCKALIAKGVEGLLFVVKDTFKGRRLLGVRDVAKRVPRALVGDVGAPIL